MDERASDSSWLDGRPQQLGHYLIIGALGEGGMGTVFDAFDPQLDRRVAIKLMRRDLSQGHATRLRREAQAMAKLSHPNVVQVYEVGVADGQTFVVMELVRGQTLKDWMYQQPRPDWRRCVEVFVQLGDGLAAAHEQGLIHRDFKPSNAIVDAQERPRVLDFGLVRRSADELCQTESSDPADPSPADWEDEPTRSATPRARAGGEGPLLDAELTMKGSVVGTLAYMPLEQMEGRVADARSDQFSFCVSLYEALYGERPFDGTSMPAMVLCLREGRVRPAPKGSTVPKALRAVLLRGLATEPTERWPTMDALLDELRTQVAPRRRRALGGIVIGVVGVGTGVGLMLSRPDGAAVPCTGASTQLEGVWDENRRQAVKEAIVGTGVSYAPQTWERVVPRIDAYAESWRDKYVEVCEATRVYQRQSEDDHRLRMRCLRGRRKSLDAAIGVLARSDASVVDNATELIMSLPPLAYCDDVDRLYERQQRVPPPEDPAVARQVEQQRDRLRESNALNKAGAHAQAMDAVEPVVTEAVALDYGPLLAEARWQLAIILHFQGKYPESERQLLEAYALAIAHDHEVVMLEVATLLMCVTGTHQERHAEGLLWGATAQPLAERVGDATNLASVLNKKGAILNGQGHYAKGVELHRRAIEVEQAALGEEHLNVSYSMANLGHVLFRQNQLEEAEKLYRQALLIQARELGPEHPETGESHNGLGIVLERQGKYSESEVEYRRSLLIKKKTLDSEHSSVGFSHNNLGNVLRFQGKLDQAMTEFRRAIEIYRASTETNRVSLAMSLSNLAAVYFVKRDYHQAQVLFEQGLQKFEAELGEEHPYVASALNNLGRTLSAQGEHERARALHERALGIQHKALSEEHPYLTWSMIGLAIVDELAGRAAEAQEYARRVVELRQRSKQPPELIAEARFVLARALWLDPKRHSEAYAVAVEARDTMDQAGSDGMSLVTLDEIERWLAEHHGPLPSKSASSDDPHG